MCDSLAIKFSKILFAYSNEFIKKDEVCNLLDANDFVSKIKNKVDGEEYQIIKLEYEYIFQEILKNTSNKSLKVEFAKIVSQTMRATSLLSYNYETEEIYILTKKENNVNGLINFLSDVVSSFLADKIAVFLSYKVVYESDKNDLTELKGLMNA